MASETTAGAVPPALTANEWRRAEQHARAAANDRPTDARRTMAADAWLFGRCDATMALANAARDDADPGKLTREDVETIRDAAEAIDYRGGLDPALMRIAAKLAALLPPREEG